MNKTITIFGGSGFIGSYIVRRLSKLGFRIIIPTSNIIKANRLKINGDVGQVIILDIFEYNLKLIKNIIKDSDIIINLKTIWLEKNNKSFENEIYNFNIMLVDVIKEFKIKKYIFFSGLGTNINSSSKRTIAIAKSENYIQKNLNDYSIIRPSIVIGYNDSFFARLIPIFKLSLFIPIFGKGSSRIQPTYVDDVAHAVEKIILKENNNNIFELGGNEVFTYKNLYKFIVKIIEKKRIFVFIPFFIIKIIVYIFEKLSIEIITREQLDLFKKDNIVSNKFLTYDDLSIDTQDIKQIISKIIKKPVK